MSGQTWYRGGGTGWVAWHTHHAAVAKEPLNVPDDRLRLSQEEEIVLFTLTYLSSTLCLANMNPFLSPADPPAPNTQPRSGPGRAPLLANASLPGMSDPRRPQSGDSMASSFASPGLRSTSTSNSPANRFGPTASFTPSASAINLARNDRPALPPSGMDDDDLDDQLHTFTAREKQDLSTPFRFTSWRGWANALTLVFLALAIVVLFAGYPILSFYLSNDLSNGSGTAGFNLGGINASGQYPLITGIPQLIDPETPQDVMTRTGFDGNQWDLVFSDEFNKDGRTFFNGDDPFFEAVDLHYWPTG